MFNSSLFLWSHKREERMKIEEMVESAQDEVSNGSDAEMPVARVNRLFLIIAIIIIILVTGVIIAKICDLYNW